MAVPGAPRVDCPASLLEYNEGLLVADNLGHVIWYVQEHGLVEVFAGQRQAGYSNGPRLQAFFNSPQCLTRIGDFIIISDNGNSCIRSLDSFGDVQIYAGTPLTQGLQDGYRTLAKFIGPDKTLLLPSGDLLVSDMAGGAIRMINAHGFVSTIAGSGQIGYRQGPLKFSRWSFPCGLAFLSSFNTILVADSENHCIRKIPYRCNDFFPRPPASDSKFSLAWLLNSSNHDTTFVDFRFNALGKEWGLHRTIIDLRCPHLFDKNATERIEKSGATSTTLNALIEWVYSDKLTCFNKFDALIELVHLAEAICAQEISSLLDWSSWETVQTLSLLPLFLHIQLNLERNMAILCRDGFEHSDDLERLRARMVSAKLDSPLGLIAGAVLGVLYSHSTYSQPEHWHPDLQWIGSAREEDDGVPRVPLSAHLSWKSLTTLSDSVLALMNLKTPHLAKPDPLGDVPIGNPVTAGDRDQKNDVFRIWSRDGEARVWFAVDEHILAARWPYFRRALQFGGSESKMKEMDLGEFLPSSELSILIYYIYSGQIPASMSLNPSKPKLLEHGRLFGFFDELWMPLEGFEVLVDALLSAELNPSTTQHLIEGYLNSKHMGTCLHRDSALSSLAKSWADVMELPDQEQATEQLSRLSDADYKVILLTQFGKRNLLGANRKNS
jgi:hypothetical protein